MDAQYWHQKWRTDDIGFHEAEGNLLLHANFKELALPAGSRVFVPLCGKTRDIGWLLSQGYRVVGVELNEMAVRQLFEDLQLVPTTTTTGGMTCLNAGDLEVFVGDFFMLAPDMLDPVDAIFDRGALVALPEDMRTRYAHHLTGIAGHAPQLLVTFEYDQTQMDGPPFSIGDADVRRHYQESYRISPLASVDVAGKLKGKCDATENVWLLHPRRGTSAS